MSTFASVRAWRDMTEDERRQSSDKAPAAEAPSDGAPAPRQISRRTPRFGFDVTPRVLDRAHSRYVRGLKVVLPASAAIIVILVFAWPQVHLRDTIPDPESLRIRPHATADLMVQGVRYVGTDSRTRRYTITAASTRQAPAEPGRVALEKPEADMTLGTGHRVALHHQGS